MDPELFCDKCLAPVTPISAADDLGTQWFSCTQCQTKTTKPLTQSQRDQSAELRQRLEAEYAPEKIKQLAEEAKKRMRMRIHLEEAEKNLSQSDRLVIYFEESEAELFLDQYSEPFVRLKIYCGTCDTCGISAFSSVHSAYIQQDSEGKVTQMPQCRNIAMPQYYYANYPLDSSFVKNWLANLMYTMEKKVPSNEGLSAAKNVLKGKAQQQGKRYTLYNRVAPDPNGNGIWLDMADEFWRAIHVTATGWEIVNTPPILFRRFPHQLPLPMPASGGDAWQLLQYTNIDPADAHTRLIFLCAVISYFIPDIAHPIITVSGAQGSAKSALLALIKKLVDPSAVHLLSVPDAPRDLSRLLYHHWLAPFDNISWVDKWASDVFCKAVTGMGIADRKLYTNDEEVIRSFKHCVMLNGISVAAQEPDLLDRCLLINLREIPAEQRKPEQALNNAVTQALPTILGGCLDVLAKALALYPTIQVTSYQRLADFYAYGCAIAIALGSTQEDFIAAYSAKVAKQHEEALNADDVALAFAEFFTKEVKVNGTWEGTPTQLLGRVCYYADTLSVDRYAKTWPKSTSIFMRRLNQLIPALKAIGITVTSYAGTPRRIVVSAAKTVSAPQQQKNEEYKTSVPSVPSVPKNAPTWYVKPIVGGGERCECGALAVTVELLTPTKDTLRRCSQCYNKLKQTYTNARWLPAHPDLAIYGEGEV